MSVRAGRAPLAGQIYQAIRRAIETGRLASGARLPPWRDLAAQLGVLPRHRACGLPTSDRRAIRDWLRGGRRARSRAPLPIINTRLVTGSAAPAGPLP